MKRVLVSTFKDDIPFISWNPYKKNYNAEFIREIGSPFYISRDLLNSDCDSEKVIKYLKDRIAEPKRSLKYLEWASNHASYTGLTNKKFNTKLNDLTTAIFYLHSFVDGFIDSRFDGFWSQNDYIMFSLRCILKNKFYTNVYLKPHPLTGLLKIDLESLEILKKRIKKQFGASVEFISPKQNLNEIGSHVCISHHGSVTEEAYFAGNPVITSSFGLWKNYPNFYSRWESPEELEELLSTDPRNLLTSASEKSRDSFYAFVSSYGSLV